MCGVALVRAGWGAINRNNYGHGGQYCDRGKGEFAQVYIKALNLGAVSDEQGRFTLSDVPAGTHELRADLIGYVGAMAVVTVTAGRR